MEKKQKKTDTILVWSREKPSEKEEILRKPHSKHFSKKDDMQKQSPEEMIRALQGIFCYGRYKSWVSYQ